jgi:hypothetical protein
MKNLLWQVERFSLRVRFRAVLSAFIFTTQFYQLPQSYDAINFSEPDINLDNI